MNIRLHLSFAALAALALLTVCVRPSAVRAEDAAEGTSFLHRGHLRLGSGPANGTYDLAISLFETNADGVAVAQTITNLATKVTNGLYHVTLDFGPGPFTGTNYWLDISVRPTGGNTFAELGTRQRLVPTPWAVRPAPMKTSVMKPRQAGRAAQIPVQNSAPAPAAAKSAPSQNQ